jgi:histidinol phosphatase-like PHP family hydrolase
MLPLVERYREAWRDFFPGVEVDYVADASLDLGDVTVRAEGYHLGYFHQDWKAKIRQILLSS